jgi:uncharacterized membrane-anchored protein
MSAPAVNPSPLDPSPHARPWPVVLLTALGAWLAAVPLMAAVYMLLGENLTRGASPYLVGLLMLTAAVLVLRSPSVPIFVEQLAVPALLVGLGSLWMGVSRDFGQTGSQALMLAVVVGLAWALPKDWLRVLLGATAAGLLAALLDLNAQEFWQLHAVLAVWLGLVGLSLRPVATTAWLVPFTAGWLLAALVGLVALTGSTFLVGGAVMEQLGASWVLEKGPGSANALRQGLSVLLVMVAFAGSLLTWPVQRTSRALVQAGVLTGVLAVLAWFMPTLGAAWLALVVTAALHRWRLASTCAVAVAWVLGAFYYQLQWPLSNKALLLMAAGSLLGGLVWWLSPVAAPSASAAPAAAKPARHTAAVWATLMGTVLTGVVANTAIWQKQDLIANGQRVYIALAPQDPRSLMQGDFMRLRFDALRVPETQSARFSGQRPRMVVQLDTRGVAKPLRLQGDAAAVAPGEMLVQLTRKDGSWVVVTDAWFFKEGDAAVWQNAKYGEFRVLPDGRALLVGLADVNLKTIQPP